MLRSANALKRPSHFVLIDLCAGVHLPPRPIGGAEPTTITPVGSCFSYCGSDVVFWIFFPMKIASWEECLFRYVDGTAALIATISLLFACITYFMCVDPVCIL